MVLPVNQTAERPAGKPAPPAAEQANGDARLDLERLFDTYGIAPLPLSLGRIPLDLVRAYHNWCDLLGTWPELETEPWLPVGSVGPC